MKKNGHTRAIAAIIMFFSMAIATAAACAALRSSVPGIVGRPLSADETAGVISRNSPLTDYAYLSPNADFPREGDICKITIHHMGADLTLEGLGASFAQRDRRASANYGIDSHGRVACYVEERNRPWTSSSIENDSMAVTIEVANDKISNEWHVSDAAYGTLVDLCVDICERNGIDRLEYTGDATGNLTLHKMFAATECPGPYLEGRMGDIADEVNERLSGIDTGP